LEAIDMRARLITSAPQGSPGFLVPEALRAAAWEEVARRRAERTLVARFGARLARPSLPQSLRPRFASRSSYYKHCKAALTKVLSPYWQGSRAALKKRLRATLHPRRRDVGLLSGLLRATVVPAALAVFMLAVPAEPAHGATFCAVSFTEQSGPANPFDGVDAGSGSAPAFGDLDGDGDLDAVIGVDDGTLKYFQNVGTALEPDFVEQTGAGTPFDGVVVETLATPALADLDGDGDLDAVVGSLLGTPAYFQNMGTALSPVFVEQTDDANPFGDVNFGASSTLAFGDLDGDGDLDATVGEADGAVWYYQNAGTALEPIFVEQTGAANPFDGVDAGSRSTPALADIGGDGDLDVVLGNIGGTLQYYENTGTAVDPVFVAPSGGDAPFDGANVGGFSIPAFADLDGDGDLDALVGNVEGTLAYFENTSNPSLPMVQERANTANLFDGADVGDNSKPVLVDLDGDGDLDVVVGEYWGRLSYFKNTGTTQAPVYQLLEDDANPFDRVGVGYRSAPALVDLDDDGDLDLVVGGGGYSDYEWYFRSVVEYHENVGTAQAPVFVKQSGEDNPFNDLNVSDTPSPALADLDGDGDLDLLLGDYSGYLNHFKNIGTAQSPVFVEPPDEESVFDGVIVGIDSAPVFADLDNDGDLDAVVGGGDLKYFKNTGTVLAPAFEEQTGAANPLGEVISGQRPHPAFGDLDGDGDLDALVGAVDGRLRHFTNTGTALAPVFTPPELGPNPLGDLEVSSHSTATFGDLDGDGDLDALVGEYDGPMNYLRNEGTAIAPDFVREFGPGDPFSSFGSWHNRTPVFADLDGDGDLDVIIGGGQYHGALRYYKNTGTAL
jgi:hypothetical protein